MLAYFQHSMNLFQTKNAVIYWISLSNLSRLSYVDPILERLHFTLHCIHSYRTLSVVVRSSLQRWLRYSAIVCQRFTNHWYLLSLVVSVWGDGWWVMRWRAVATYTLTAYRCRLTWPVYPSGALRPILGTVNLYCHKLTIIKWTLFISHRKGGCIRTSVVLCS